MKTVRMISPKDLRKAVVGFGRRTKRKATRLVTMLFLLSGCFASLSCLDEGYDDCWLDFRFRYIYNMEQADGLEQEASQIKLWIFNADSTQVTYYEDRDQVLNAAYNLSVPPLPPGEYIFVAVAESNDRESEGTHFIFPQHSEIATLTDLTARLERDARNVNGHRLNTLLMGMRKVRLEDGDQEVLIDLMKCTNTLRLLLLDTGSSQVWSTDLWDISIEGKNGWLAHDASPYREDSLIYRPYIQEVSRDTIHQGAEPVHQLLVAEMSTSRWMTSLDTRLVVRRRDTGQCLVNINLPWLLSLQAIEEHRATWSDQEYLDRQDEYTLTLLTDGSTWLRTRLVVNGWVLSLADIDL